MRITEIFETIQNTAGTNDKKRFLKEHMNTTIKWIFDDCYGKRKYYIKTFEPKPGCQGELTLDNDYLDFHHALDRLAKREITGDEAYAYLQQVVSSYTVEDQIVLCKIIDRNLKIGVSLDNFLDIIGKKSEKFEVALAESLAKAKNINAVDGTYFVSRKLDGVRCICIVNKTDEHIAFRFMSRQGKQFTTLNNLTPFISYFVGPLSNGNWVFDGEICIIDENGKESFSGIMKEITRKDHTIEHPRYKVFDLLTLDEFEGKVESETFSVRHDRLCSLQRNFECSALEVVVQQRVTSQEILDAWVGESKEEGWEGCMLRKDVAYKRGRSKDLLKIKEMQDAEYIVYDIETGKATYNEGGHKEFDVVTALKITHKDNVVSVGSGLSKEQRLRWYEHPEEIIGKVITVQYFEETVDSKTGKPSLRFPVLKYVYEGGRNV